MTRKTAAVAAERTPVGRLAEPGLHDIMGYQLAQASVVTNAIFRRCVAEPEGMGKVEFTILALVQANPEVSARQLAQALAVTPPNIAMWLDKLEQRGWVARTRSTRDARVQHVSLTAEGTDTVNRCVQALHAAEHEAMATLSAAEQAMLVELLHKLARARSRAA
ncbi:MarR family winged helix-turn-helix transcriptional regulator [Ideonella alba]|uniref:MarR family transcriptional regulator n=1 Tax=Ideonella alba TaxID=2824118 RepID=A0A941BFN1_9BURK|nr:MarR family transcriptional regulator [Ideonella alba]MBQ0929598.1 MarR family transcriptional regulator [Ideonella alba]